MPRETLESARQVMEALGRPDPARLIALADPEVEWHSFFAALGEGGVYRGHDGTRQYMSDLSDAWELVRADIDDGIAGATASATRESPPNRTRAGPRCLVPFP